MFPSLVVDSRFYSDSFSPKGVQDLINFRVKCKKLVAYGKYEEVLWELLLLSVRRNGLIQARTNLIQPCKIMLHEPYLLTLHVWEFLKKRFWLCQVSSLLLRQNFNKIFQIKLGVHSFPFIPSEYFQTLQFKPRLMDFCLDQLHHSSDFLYCILCDICVCKRNRKTAIPTPTGWKWRTYQARALRI